MIQVKDVLFHSRSPLYLFIELAMCEYYAISVMFYKFVKFDKTFYLKLDMILIGVFERIFRFKTTVAAAASSASFLFNGLLLMGNFLVFLLRASC